MEGHLYWKAIVGRPSLGGHRWKAIVGGIIGLGVGWQAVTFIASPHTPPWYVMCVL